MGLKERRKKIMALMLAACVAGTSVVPVVASDVSVFSDGTDESNETANRTVNVKLVDEDTQKFIAGGDVLIDQTTTTMNVNDLINRLACGLPEGYEVCASGDVWVGDDSVTIEVRKIVKTKDITIVYQNRKGKIIDDKNIITVDKNAISVNTGDLTAPKGYTIAITGDIVDGKTEARLHDVAPLADLVAPYGVFGIEGNHEHYAAYEAWMRVLPTLNFDMLFNEHRFIKKDGATIALAGITDPMAQRYHRSEPNVEKAIEGIPENMPIILLSHQVKYTKDYAKYPIALQLSGHTHGGQILGMHWLAQFLNKGFVKDYYRVGDLQLYVSRGTGLWYGFPIRLGISSEITLITLKASQN